MQNYQKTLLDFVTKTANQGGKNRQIVYLEGGYYDSKLGPTEFSVNTLAGMIAIAEEMVKKQYSVTRVILGVLVNNIGIVCGEDAREIPSKKTYQKDIYPVLPGSFEKMLQNSKVLKNDQVVFTNERKLRNRSSRIVKKLAQNLDKYSLTVDEKAENEVVYNITIGGKKVPLAIKRGDVWSARCPLIMSQHYLDLYVKFAKKYGNSVTQILVDMCEMYDRYKVNNGAAVALLLIDKLYGYDVSNLKIINFCFQDDELTNYEYDIAERCI